MTLRKRAMTTLAVVLGMFAGTLVAAAPASAYRADCFNYTDVVCLTEHGDWGGYIWRQRSYQITGCRAFEPKFNDLASAWYNNTAYTIVLWEHANCDGRFRRYPPGHIVEGGGAGEYNDMFSAVMVTSI